MISTKFHIFVSISTFVYYYILKKYESAVYKKNSKNSRIIYLVFVPIILYTSYYLMLNYTGDCGNSTYPVSFSTLSSK